MIIGSLLLIFAAVVLLAFGLPARSDPLLIGSIVTTLLAVIVLIGSARRTAALRLATGRDAPAGNSPTAGPGPGSVRPGPLRTGTPMFGRATRANRGGTVIEGSVIDEPVIDGPVIDDRPVDDRADPATHTPVSTASARPGPAATTAVEDPSAGGTTEDARNGAVPTQTRPTIDLNARPDEVPSEAADDGPDYADGEFSDEDPPGEPPPQLVSAANADLVAAMANTVLVVDGRPRYHRAGCAFLRGRPTEPLPVSEAVELGFTPCGRCEPDTALIAGARPS